MVELIESMQKLSQSQKIVQFLKDNPDKKFNARQIAEQIVAKYPEDYVEKKLNPRFEDEKSFISQVVAEIGSQKEQILKNNSRIFWRDKPRPRIYWYDTEKIRKSEEQMSLAFQEESRENTLSEDDLYPILVMYLQSELKLYCLRIDEKRSKNSRGSGGNQWLHPDIVALQTVDKEWDELIRNCVKQGTGQSVRLWSFEVKKELNSSNVRKSFFQTVSNSSWANESYLVAISIADTKVEQELRMLSALHGIGVILLNVENPTESEMMLPSRPRAEVDWQSVNRILVENKDFKDYIELVSTYYQTGRIRPKDWNKL